MRRQALRLGLPLGLLGLLAGAPATHASDDPGSGLGSYTLSASAPGLALEGLYKDVELTVPETTSTLTTGGVGSGLAALGWPGPILGNAGTTLLVLQPSAPSQVTMLNDPVKAQARTAGPTDATNASVPGTVMHATAAPDRVTASSDTGSGTTLPVGTVGTISGSSQVALQGAATAVGSARSVVQHLSLAGGQVEIGSVVSTATGRSDGRQASATGSTTVTGVTVAGVPVVVDGKGIHVAGHDAGNPVPVTTVSDAVKALGLTMVLTTPTEVQQAGSVRYAGAALVVVLNQGGHQVALTLGRASVGLDASPALDLGALLPTGTGPAAPAAAAATGSAPAAGLGAPTGSTTGSLGSTGSAPSLPAPVTAAVGALAPVAALALASGAPPVLALGLLAVGALLALLLGRLPGLLLVPPAPDCEDLS